jgi:REP element-mobilizing transposase RayT
LINPTWEEELFKYITGIVQNKGQKMLEINGSSNHIHFLIGMKPTCCLSDLVREIKKSSNSFVKEKRFTKFNFQWQEGFGAFSYSHSALDNVIRYIQKQKEHQFTAKEFTLPLEKQKTVNKLLDNMVEAYRKKWHIR